MDQDANDKPEPEFGPDGGESGAAALADRGKVSSRAGAGRGSRGRKQPGAAANSVPAKAGRQAQPASLRTRAEQPSTAAAPRPPKAPATPPKTPGKERVNRAGAKAAQAGQQRKAPRAGQVEHLGKSISSPPLAAKPGLPAGSGRGSPSAGAGVAPKPSLLGRFQREKRIDAKKVVEQIERGPKGPRVVAVFDFDGTLISGFSGGALLKERMRRRDVKLAEIADSVATFARAVTKNIEMHELVAHAMAQWAGKSDEEMEELGEHLFDSTFQDNVFPEMLAIVDAHRRAGHTLVVASSASRYQVEPTARALGIEHVLCTQVEVVGGRLTGRLLEPSMWGPGKAAAVQRFVADAGGALADTHFYADGDEEAGLMEMVGHPRPVNPQRLLTSFARQQGWPVLRFASRGRAPPLLVARSLRGTMNALPLIYGGLVFRLMTGDRRTAANVVTPLMTDRTLRNAGVKLRVSGRKHLWARRPAVFIFNHRNNFDALIALSLVRTDIATIGKKELKKNPFVALGSLLVPTAFVERGGRDPAKAREALQPVTDMVEQGYSVLLAPEGTRVRELNVDVGPFKMGAFHIAMAAGVPIVPIVIRNALDIGARNAAAIRPGTVDVAVLPPVPTDGWNVKSLKGDVAKVRQMFIDTLHDWPEADEDA